MPGRTILLALGALLALAGPAAADETLGLGQPAAVDGVVTSWRLQPALPQSDVRLTSTQALGGGGTATTATGDPVSGATQTVAARLPIAAGGTLALTGAIGSVTVAATVEPDHDGDLYGDTTQDACPDDATTRVAPCRGTRTVGSPLTLAPDPRGFTMGGATFQALQETAAGTVVTVPRDGILVRWRLRAQPGLGDTLLEVFRPDGDGVLKLIFESGPVHVTTTDSVMLTAKVPVRAGDRIAARSAPAGGSSDLGTLAHVPGDVLDVVSPPTTLFWTVNPTHGADQRLLVQADVEPDADGDGRGDVTQDSADLQLTGFAPAQVRVDQSWSMGYTVRNAGPDPALGVVLAFRGAGVVKPGVPPAGVTCVDAGPGSGQGADCTIPRLDPGASMTMAPWFIEPAIYPPLPGTIATTATVTAITSDPDPTNNSAALTTVRTALPPNAPVPPVKAAPACGNVIRGTRDDDVLRGTAFPDRLVGGDGGDLLKGNGADDCLEGGAGADVLDGGDGNDRIDGASGNDRLIGGKGDDKLTAGKGNDRLTGGAGNDTISPGAGRDTVDAGAGNDTNNAVDGVRETIECGPGKDTVRADRRDHLKHCEKITRKR
jgi:hypothetical protein